VRQGGRAFQQQQAARGCGREKATSAGFFDQMFVVFLRFEAEQGKTKSVLAG
jgi:hypothetical protein